MTSRVASLLARPVRFAEWLFSPLAPGIDLLLLFFALSWAALAIFHPHGFQTGAWRGTSWAPMSAWLVFRLMIAALCLIGLANLHWRSVRVAAAFLSAWHWLFISFSLLRVELAPGVLAYFILGIWSIFAGIYLGGLPEKDT